MQSQVSKCHRCTHLWWLWHHVSRKSQEISKFLTLQPKPWHMLGSGGDKRLKCLKERPLSVGSAVCCFVDWTLPLQWIFFVWKTDFTLLSANFSKFQRRPTLSARFCRWRTVRCWSSLVSRKKLEISFYNCPHWFWIHYKITSHFFHRAFRVPPYPLSNSFDVAFRRT